MGATFSEDVANIRNKNLKVTICITIKFLKMNKKLFLGMFAAAGMLLATSCSNDELDAVQSGNEAQVTFSIGTEGGIATRAISDGKSADVLYYAIYDADQKLITTIANSENGLLKKTNAFPGGSKQDNVTVTLAKGQEYTAVFWAQDTDCEAYTVTAETDGLKVAVDYKGTNNDETRDAFFKAETFTVTGNAEIDVELKRPFAQINVGVTEADWNAAVASGVTISESKVVIKNAATSINLLDGTVSGEQAVEYDFAAIPTDPATLEVDVDRDGTIEEDEKYKYLSMSYILTSAEKTILESDGLQFTFKSGGSDIVFDEGLHAVPVQRNWRTNILGKLLTGDIQFNIVIDERFYDDYNYPKFEDVTNGVKYDAATKTYYLYSAAGLAWLSTETNTNNNQFSGYTVKLTSDVDMNGITFAPIGKSKAFLGTFDGGNNTISNLTVNVTDDDDAAGLFASARTVKNVKLKDVNISGHYKTGAIVGDGLCAIIENCHVDGGTVTSTPNSQNNNANNVGGIVGYLSAENTAYVKNCSVKNLKITAYRSVGGIAGRTNGTTAAVENCTVDNVTVIADMLCEYAETGKASAAGMIVGDNRNNAELSSNITNNVTVNVFAIENGVATVGTVSGITTALKNNVTTVNLTAGEYNIPSEAKGKTLTITGTSNPADVVIKVIGAGQSEANGQLDYNLDGSTVTFNNVTIKTNNQTYAGYARLNATYNNCIMEQCYCLNGNSTFTDCKLNVSGDQYNIWTWGAKDMTFTRCTFNSDGKALLLYQEGTNTVNLKVDECTFNDKGGLTDKKAAIEIGDAPYGATPTYNVTVLNTTVNGYEINDEGINTGTTLWGNKNSMPAERLNVTVDGENVY